MDLFIKKGQCKANFPWKYKQYSSSMENVCIGLVILMSLPSIFCLTQWPIEILPIQYTKSINQFYKMVSLYNTLYTFFCDYLL